MSFNLDSERQGFFKQTKFTEVLFLLIREIIKNNLTQNFLLYLISLLQAAENNWWARALDLMLLHRDVSVYMTGDLQTRTTSCDSHQRGPELHITLRALRSSTDYDQPWSPDTTSYTPPRPTDRSSRDFARSGVVCKNQLARGVCRLANLSGVQWPL